jgi:hypothetical protein
LTKVAPRLEYFFKLCDEGGTSDCGAVDYDVVLAIADFDGDGDYEADEVFDISLATCGPSETSFVAELDITDDLDVDGDPVTVEVFNQDANGEVRGSNNNKLKSRGCGWTANNAATAFDPDITGRKCRFNANPKAEDELPFTAQDLVDQEVISDVSDLNCTSTVFADAGPDQIVNIGDLVTLDGSGSTPAGGTFSWVFTVTPPGSTAALSGADTANPTFTPDVDGTYTVEFTYTVGAESDTDTVDVVVANPVTAYAGEDQATLAGKVTLDGSGSTPAGGTFSWAFIVRPIGSNTFLVDADTANPTFIADEDGVYVILLTYTVGPNSDTDIVIYLVADI